MAFKGRTTEVPIISAIAPDSFDSLSRTSIETHADADRRRLAPPSPSARKRPFDRGRAIVSPVFGDDMR
jgi:hypothetical protein